MSSIPRNVRNKLDALHRNHCSGPDGDYLKEGFEAAREHGNRKRQSIVDLSVDAANLTLSVINNPAILEDNLVSAAIRDTNPNFDFTSPPTGQALEGAVNSAKGKYFEYLVVDRLNSGERVGDVILPSGYSAELAESFSQPGWDIRIIDENKLNVEYLQLKATNDLSYVKEALDRYPTITILTTDEIAVSGLESGLLNSEISNSFLEDTVHEAIGLVDASFADSLLNAFNPLISLAFIVGTEAYRVSFDKADTTKTALSIAHRGARTIVSQGVGASVYALGGGVLAIPAVFTTGLVYEHMAELYEASSLLESHITELSILRSHQRSIFNY
jgi:hypothetical protein